MGALTDANGCKIEDMDAEKALEDMHPWMPEEEYQIILTALQRSAECEKVIDQYAETIRIQTVNGNSLKRKARGLIKALEDIAYSKTFRVQNKPFELVAIALQALAAFNSDETEGE